jgi:hypothetical protein
MDRRRHWGTKTAVLLGTAAFALAFTLTAEVILIGLDLAGEGGSHLE